MYLDEQETISVLKYVSYIDESGSLVIFFSLVDVN